jgi:alanine-synthesizing transaminase
LRKAQALLRRRFGVKLDPDTPGVATLGSKEGFANMAQAITAPGDVILSPTRAIRSTFGFLMAGGVIRDAGRAGTGRFFMALERAVMHSVPKPIAMILCYPANPTAYCADLDFYKDVVAFARKHDIFVLSDLAYSEIYFGDDAAAVGAAGAGRHGCHGRIHLAVEDLSMPGWRMGFAVGNERLIAALARVKSYLDYGAFTPIQVAATAALNGRTIASSKRATSTRSAATCWSRASAAPVGTFRRRKRACSPGRRSRRNSAISARWSSPSLLIEKADVAVAPGIGFGEYGDDHVRIALVENEQRIRQAARNIAASLKRADKTAQRRPT